MIEFVDGYLIYGGRDLNAGFFYKSCPRCRLFGFSIRKLKDSQYDELCLLKASALGHCTKEYSCAVFFLKQIIECIMSIIRIENRYNKKRRSSREQSSKIQ